MSFEIETDVDFKAIQTAVLSRIDEALRPAIADAVLGIIGRTQAGNDVFGRPFAPYTPEYRKSKNATGRARRPSVEGRGETVNLTFTGQMLKAIQSEVRREGDTIVAEIFIQNAGGNEGVKARENQKTRPFFGLDEGQLDRIQKRVDDALEGI